MKRYILTGTPGAGKTAVLRYLEQAGYAVVEEAATAVIALRHAQGVGTEPWRLPSFLDDIAGLQRQRQLRAAGQDAPVVFFDRSPVCTQALRRFVELPRSAALAAELDRIAAEQVYERTVFFLRNLGFCEPTAARRITFADSLRFEQVHADTYREYGYDLVDIPAGPVAERAAAILHRLD